MSETTGTAKITDADYLPFEGDSDERIGKMVPLSVPIGRLVLRSAVHIFDGGES